MKFSLIAVPFLAAFAVAAPTVNDASLVARDGGSQIESLLDGLLASVKQYTASMSTLRLLQRQQLDANRVHRPDCCCSAIQRQQR